MKEKNEIINNWKIQKQSLSNWKLSSSCANCGSVKYLTFHHIFQKSKGGGNEKSNLMILCRQCHDRVHSSEGLYIPLEKSATDFYANDESFELLRKLNPKLMDDEIIDILDVSEISSINSISP